jgi:bifunctional DNA-binding transcriptional regulator/antitoxin component of YhaV-PrlF toxin-antitoxin module
MGKGNVTTVYRNKEGQYQTTIPRGLAEAMGLEKGSKLEWMIEGKNTFKVRIL